MKLLIVEGNPRSVWQLREEQGGVAYHRRFIQILESLGYSHVDVAFPVENHCLPNQKQLSQFHGILLTGSSLNIYTETVEVTRQLEFAEHCFSSGVPIYGSCWGLQVAVTIAGGKIARGQNGREFGIAKNITLTKMGKKSPYFLNKPSVFDTYCIHEDDTHQLPENSEILATNAHSMVQALQLHYLKSPFFGVQYHPEFTSADIEFLANIMFEKLMEEGIFSDQPSKEDYLKQMAKHPTIHQPAFTTLEIANWINSLK